MAVVNPLTQSDDAVVIDDRLILGMGKVAEEVIKRLSGSTQAYYSLSEALPKYLPASHLNRWFVIDTSPFERAAKRALGDTISEIHELLEWNEDWNSYGAPKPRYDAVVYAEQWITNFFREVADLGWVEPNVTGGPEGGVVFEWWYRERKLTIYVDEQSVEFVQVRGTDINAKITVGDIGSMKDCRRLWMWLIRSKE